MEQACWAMFGYVMHFGMSQWPLTLFLKGDRWWHASTGVFQQGPGPIQLAVVASQDGWLAKLKCRQVWQAHFKFTWTKTRESWSLHFTQRGILSILLCFVVVIHDGNFYKTNQYAYLCSSMILLLRCSQNLAPIFTKRRCPLKNWGPGCWAPFSCSVLGANRLSMRQEYDQIFGWGIRDVSTPKCVPAKKPKNGGGFHLIQVVFAWCFFNKKCSDMPHEVPFIYIIYIYRNLCTLPKFNSWPLKNDGWKTIRLPFGKVLVSGAIVKLQVGSCCKCS